MNISAVEATPGYLPGILPIGAWTAMIDTHRIMPGEPVHYSLDVSITEGASKAMETLASLQSRPLKTPPRGADWYRGDLHCHTHHSDADGVTVAVLIDAARDHGLDFLFLTDHNTISGLAEMDESATEDRSSYGWRYRAD